MKLAMAMSPMMGDEESQRLREVRTQRAREARAKAWAEFRQHLAHGARKTFVFLFGTVVMFYLVINLTRLEDFTGAVGHRLSARVNTPSVLKQNALHYEEQVNEISK